MPRRARGQPLLPQTLPNSTKRKRASKHVLGALQQAEQQIPARTKVKANRVGEIENEFPSRQRSTTNDRPPNKRRRVEADVAGAEEEHGDMNSDDGPWHVGVESGDEDSDLDSEEALGASDEDKFERFAFRGSTSRGSTSTQTRPRSKKAKSQADEQRGLETDLPEGEEPSIDENSKDVQDEDDLGEDAVDLVTALDMNEEEEAAEKHSHPLKVGKESTNASDEDLSEDSRGGAEEEDEEEDSTTELTVSDGEQSKYGTSKLRSFVDGLQSEERPKTLPRDKRTISVSEKPSDFGIRSSTKLTAADLLPSITNPALRRSLKLLHNNEKASPKSYSGGVPGKLEPPLAKRQQDRLDRAAAYEMSKETLNRWVDTVKQNRRAEHLSFPLTSPDATAVPGLKNMAPVTSSAPLTSLERTIASIMAESGFGPLDGKSAEEQEKAFEGLAERNMPIEEVQARRAELRKARDLMFREEVRARRIKKIKSKAYRRVHRKERDKNAQEERATLAAAGLLNSDDERKRIDRQRAEERMGARHRESRWAKDIKARGRAAWDEDARNGVTEAARRDEELRRRIEGKEAAISEGSVSESTDSEDDFGSEEHTGVYQSKLERVLSELEKQGPQVGSRSALESMAFMQKAEAARKATNDAEIEKMRQELLGQQSTEVAIEAPAGRRSLGLKKKEKQDNQATLPREDFEEVLSEDEDTVNRQARDQSEDIRIVVDAPQSSKRVGQKPERRSRTQQEIHDREGENGTQTNPWLAKATNVKNISNDAEPLIDSNLANMLPTTSRSKQGNQPKKRATIVPVGNGVASESSADSGEEAEQVGGESTRNQELVRMAFAGDNVFANFEREKKETMEEEDDQIIDNTLPGWGSWAGAGISKREQKRAKGRFVTTIKGIPKDQRKDAKLEKVIVNEKIVKKSSKYLTPDLPHPFESRQQYERSLRLPLGPEWTTKTTFQDATKPRVLLKQGIIRPMERPTV